jgi:6-phosphogluconolactonase (cycloisomerase 2 family)
VQTNNLGANRIIVYDRAWDGTLTRVTSYLTGGKGGMAAGSAADPLASQGALVSAEHGRVLLAVNAGSDSISLFRVHGDHLWLAQVAASGGQFPASIAVHGDWVYVLNAGGQGSVQGYWLAGDTSGGCVSRTARSAWATPTRPTSCTRPARSASHPTAAG